MTMPPTFSEKGNIYAIVETPRGSRSKYNYDEATGSFFLKKILPPGFSFPLDFGFIPHTKAEDGDPMDVMIFMEEPAYPGCIIECRVIGIITAKQTKNGKSVRNDRVLSVATQSKEFEAFKDINDLTKEFLKNLGRFFETYHELENSDWKVHKIEDAEKAIKLIKKSME